MYCSYLCRHLFWKPACPVIIIDINQQAQLKVASNRASWRRSSGRPLPKGTLVYVQNSPDFCPATRGRRCLHPENCGILCCCRGYISLSVAEDRHCNCHWVHRYHKLSCSTCTFKKEIYVCKWDISPYSEVIYSIMKVRSAYSCIEMVKLITIRRKFVASLGLRSWIWKQEVPLQRW